MSLFVFENPTLEQSAYATDYQPADPVVYGEFERCPLCQGILRARPWLPPHRAEIRRWGALFGDVAFGPSDDVLVSDRFVDAWARSGLTGLRSFDPVEILRVKGRGTKAGTVQRYWRVNAPFSRASIDEAASGIRWEGGGAICPECRFRRSGNAITQLERVILQPEPVPDEDVFFARGLWGVRLASERFKAFVERHDLLNVVLISAELFNFRYDSSD